MHRKILCQLSYDTPDLIRSTIFLFTDEAVGKIWVKSDYPIEPAMHFRHLEHISAILIIYWFFVNY